VRAGKTMTRAWRNSEGVRTSFSNQTEGHPNPGYQGDYTMEQVLEKVQEAFKSAFGIDPQAVTIDTTPNDIAAWDSMGHVELAFSLEAVFGLTLDVQDLMDMEDVRRVVSVVERKLGREFLSD